MVKKTISCYCPFKAMFVRRRAGGSILSVSVPVKREGHVASMKAVAEVSAITELRVAHWQIWKTCVIAFCALRKQRCGIAYCGPQKHAALPTSGSEKTQSCNRYTKQPQETFNLKSSGMLCRECVLTAFSIKPSQELLNRIRELAAFSGLDKIQVP
jgi:hypothetical protein